MSNAIWPSISVKSCKGYSDNKDSHCQCAYAMRIIYDVCTPLASEFCDRAYTKRLAFGPW